MTDAPATPLVTDELQVLAGLVPLDRVRVVEPGCGPARLAQDLLARHPGCEVIGLDLDDRQLARNAERPMPGLHFLRAGAQAMPLDDEAFDLALMLKSLHHVPIEAMDQALAEVWRVLRVGAHLYVSEPVYDGALNDVVRLFNDEGVVRAAAQQALDRALQEGGWQAVAERRFEMPVHFEGLEDFERRMMRPTFADHHIDEIKLEAVRRALAPHWGPGGADFTRPMHVRLLRKSPH